jgi:hypothetical protein
VLAVTVAGIRETKRFTDLAWRLACLLPASNRDMTPKDRIELWHFSAGLVFQNYNQCLTKDFHVQCSDGVTRNLAIIFFNWMGDHEEINMACSQVKVCTYQFTMCTHCTCTTYLFMYNVR